MSTLGIPPRTMTMICLALAILGAVLVAAGYFPPSELLMVAALLSVALVNWRRARVERVRSTSGC